jgi:hypothetical protein
MENPYQSPEEPCGPFAEAVPEGSFPRPGGLVRHVRVVAILMIVQGALELGMAILLGVLAVVVPQVAMQAAASHPQDSLPPETFLQIMTFTYGGMAAATGVAALLHIIAGVRNYRFRGKVFGIVAMACGVLSALSCYCLPTAVGLGVYGLIVYLNEGTAEAFRVGESGVAARQILDAFRPAYQYKETER